MVRAGEVAQYVELSTTLNQKYYIELMSQVSALKTACATTLQMQLAQIQIFIGGIDAYKLITNTYNPVTDTAFELYVEMGDESESKYAEHHSKIIRSAYRIKPNLQKLYIQFGRPLILSNGLFKINIENGQVVHPFPKTMIDSSIFIHENKIITPDLNKLLAEANNELAYRQLGYLFNSYFVWQFSGKMLSAETADVFIAFCKDASEKTIELKRNIARYQKLPSHASITTFMNAILMHPTNEEALVRYGSTSIRTALADAQEKLEVTSSAHKASQAELKATQDKATLAETAHQTAEKTASDRIAELETKLAEANKTIAQEIAKNNKLAKEVSSIQSRFDTATHQNNELKQKIALLEKPAPFVTKADPLKQQITLSIVKSIQTLDSVKMDQMKVNFTYNQTVTREDVEALSPVQSKALNALTKYIPEFASTESANNYLMLCCECLFFIPYLRDNRKKIFIERLSDIFIRIDFASTQHKLGDSYLLKASDRLTNLVLQFEILKNILHDENLRAFENTSALVQTSEKLITAALNLETRKELLWSIMNNGDSLRFLQNNAAKITTILNKIVKRELLGNEIMTFYASWPANLKGVKSFTAAESFFMETQKNSKGGALISIEQWFNIKSVLTESYKCWEKMKNENPGAEIETFKRHDLSSVLVSYPDEVTSNPPSPNQELKQGGRRNPK